MMNAIKRVLMVQSQAGKGTDNDPYRWVYTFINEKTLEEICRIDAYKDDHSFNDKAATE